ncbi:MAG: four helix bundle protein [Fimbriimonadaceae bacterium]|nr:four helix bundle protein [Fimbriimonadaceae bacterium]
MSIESYRDLDVWQRGRRVVREVYDLTRGFPSEERFGLTSQMRRAAVSIPSNLAEGWARHYPAEFIQFIRIANGSTAELETQLLLSIDLGLVSEPHAQPLLEELAILGRQILSLERSLKRRTTPPDASGA